MQMRRDCKNLKDQLNRMLGAWDKNVGRHLDWKRKRQIAVGSCLVAMSVALCGAWQNQKTDSLSIKASSNANSVMSGSTREEKDRQALLDANQKSMDAVTESTTQAAQKKGQPNQNAKAVVSGPDGIIYPPSMANAQAAEHNENTSEAYNSKASKQSKSFSNSKNKKQSKEETKNYVENTQKNRVVRNESLADSEQSSDNGQNSAESPKNQVVSNPEPTQHVTNTYGDYGTTREKKDETGQYQYPVEIGYEQDSNYDGKQSEQDIILTDRFELATTQEREDSSIAETTTEMKSDNKAAESSTENKGDTESNAMAGTEDAVKANETTESVEAAKAKTTTKNAEVAKANETQKNAKVAKAQTMSKSEENSSAKTTTESIETTKVTATTESAKVAKTNATTKSVETTKVVATTECEKTTKANAEAENAKTSKAQTMTKSGETTKAKAVTESAKVAKEQTTTETTEQAESKGTTELPQNVKNFLYHDVMKMILPTKSNDGDKNSCTKSVRSWTVNTTTTESKNSVQNPEDNDRTIEIDGTTQNKGSNFSTANVYAKQGSTTQAGATTELESVQTTTQATTELESVQTTTQATTKFESAQATTQAIMSDVATANQDIVAPALGLDETQGYLLQSGDSSIFCTSNNRISVLTNDDFNGVKGSGVQKIGYVYANHLKYIVDSIEDAKLHLPNHFYGKVLANATDLEGNVSGLMSRYVLVEQTAPSISWSDGETCSAPYTLWVDLEDNGEIVSGIRDVECYVNGEEYEITDLYTEEKTFLSNDLQVPTKSNFSVLLPEAGEYTVKVKVTDNAGNAKEETRVIKVSEADLVSVYMPEYFTIHIDPWKQYSEKQIYSDEVVLNNNSTCDVKVTIDNINLKVNAKKADAGAIKDCNIYLVTPDTGERIKLKQGNNKKVYSYRLPKNVDITKSYLYFDGDISEGSEKMWQDTDISIKMQLSFSKWEG